MNIRPIAVPLSAEQYELLDGTLDDAARFAAEDADLDRARDSSTLRQAFWAQQPQPAAGYALSAEQWRVAVRELRQGVAADTAIGRTEDIDELNQLADLIETAIADRS